MRSLLLYSAFKRELENRITAVSDIAVCNNYVDYKSDYQIGIYTASDTPTRKRMNGKKYIGDSVAVEILVQSGLESNTDIKVREILQIVENFLTDLQNSMITTEADLELLSNDDIHYVEAETDRQIENGDGIDLIIASTSIINYGNYIGKNETGRMMFSINAIVSYYIKGNNIVTKPINTGGDEESAGEEPADNSELDANSDSTEITQEDN